MMDDPANRSTQALTPDADRRPAKRVSPCPKPDAAPTLTAEADEALSRFQRESGPFCLKSLIRQFRGQLHPDQCEDVCQDTFKNWWQWAIKRIEAGKAHDVENGIAFFLWAARRNAIRMWRNARRYRSQQLMVDVESPDWLKQFEDRDNRERLKALLIEGMGTLPPHHRRVVWAIIEDSETLEAGAGGRYNALAERLGISVGTFRGIRQRALDKLKEYVQRHWSPS